MYVKIQKNYKNNTKYIVINKKQSLILRKYLTNNRIYIIIIEQKEEAIHFSPYQSRKRLEYLIYINKDIYIKVYYNYYVMWVDL